MKNEKWLKDELRAFVRNCKEHAREDRRQAKQCSVSDPKRAETLLGSAEAMEYAVKNIRRILKGQTSAEAMAEMLGRTVAEQRIVSQ